ncbi:hypothetical protein MSVAZ_3152 [Methanosarcina vacuolata Z-761]|uniref:Bulb-type lectin domain-containing protein n=2 Tax=Methanosarcina vacuolata TaxID=2215 RepID=A0A0E3LI53_9EURY|nr:hypothetical protein MSVAZ_3152 [Methanosarcina vacuolata Z-761]
MSFTSLREYLEWNRFDPSEGIRQVPIFQTHSSVRSLFTCKYRIRNVLLSKQQLKQRDQLVSKNHFLKLNMQADGNAVLYRTDNNKALWASNTSMKPVNRIVMKEDGNLKACDPADNVYWESGTQGCPDSKLVLQDDGNLVILDNSGQIRWITHTEQGWDFNVVDLFNFDIKELFYNLNVWEKILNLISLAGFLWDDKQNIFYSKVDPWQANFGYLNLYDEASPLAGMFIHCEPIRFKAGGKSWKIEFWKGRYGIFIGAEIGVYTGEFEIDTGIEVIDRSINNLDSDKDTRCACGEDEMLQMSFELYDNNDLLFSRNSDDPDTDMIEKHWWLTGFKFPTPDTVSVSYNDLIMNIEIAFMDQEMTDGFINGLERLGYSRNTDFFVYGNTVRVTFKRPRSTAHQPFLQP